MGKLGDSKKNFHKVYFIEVSWSQLPLPIRTLLSSSYRSETGWDSGPFVAGLQRLHLNTALLISLRTQQNTKRLYGTKRNCTYAQLGQILDKRHKETKKPNSHSEAPGAKAEGWEHSRVPCNPPHTTPSKAWVRKTPWRREWPPTPVFLPGEFRGWRSLVGYSPWGHKELDTTEMI